MMRKGTKNMTTNFRLQLLNKLLIEQFLPWLGAAAQMVEQPSIDPKVEGSNPGAAVFQRKLWKELKIKYSREH
jgi:hypothetical protein